MPYTLDIALVHLEWAHHTSHNFSLDLAISSAKISTKQDTMPYPIHFRLALPPGCQLANYSDYSELVFPPELVSEVSTWFTTTKDRFDCESSGRAAEATADLCTNCEKGIVKVNGASQLCPNCFGSCRAGFRPPGIPIQSVDQVKPSPDMAERFPTSERINIQKLAALLAQALYASAMTQQHITQIAKEITTP